jgi:diguanylate cyclase (GGDEF)-like protein
MKIGNPVTRLTRMADTVLKGEVFEGIKNGPKETQQLSNNLTILTSTLSHQANHDSLTNLHNRRAFQRILINSVSDANDSDILSILCYIDLDRFKMVNDTCGHSAGDKLLIEVAQLLQDNVRDSDFVARLGGDEFAILLHGCTTSTALRICNKILNSIRDIRFAWEEEIFTISASIGITPFTNSDTNTSTRPQEIINTADMACKKAKESGRDNVQIFDVSSEIITQKRDEITWVNKLNTAIEEGHFVLFKQKIVPIGKTQEKGDHFEILIRMMANDGSLLPPSDFIPIAERYYLGARLDKWVVNAVIEWFLAHPAELDKLSMCSINFSGQSVGNKGIRKFIINKLHATNFPTEKLCFEITETAAVTDLSNAHLLIDELRALGCKFSLDDFGSGLSSFAYLKDLPVDIIKIDGSFIQDMMSNNVNVATVEAINGVAKAVGKQTIAEFVESAETLQELEKIGVDFAQGYHFHKPEPLKDQAMVKLNVTSQSTNSEVSSKLSIVG